MPADRTTHQPLLRVQLLGGLSTSEPGFQYSKPLALLALVVAKPEKVLGREAVAALLWPDSDPGAARSGLRQALYQVRSFLPRSDCGSFLLADRENLWLNPRYPLDSDLGRFLRALAAGADADDSLLQEGVAAYRGPFLDGFNLGGDTPFDEWVAEQRAWLRDQARLSFSRLIARQTESGDLDAALQSASRYVSLDPEDDAGRRQLDEILARIPLRREATEPSSGMEQRCLTVVYCEPPLPRTRVEEKDLETVATARQAARQELEHRGGRVETAPAGTLIAYFGLPPAAERAVPQACSAALALLERSELVPEGEDGPRIGIHSDWTLMGPGGHPDYVGGVTRRARAAALAAPPGGIRLTPSVSRRLPSHFFLEPAPETDGHGPLFALSGEGRGGEGPGGPLVDRRDDLAALLQAGRAASRGRGSVVAVVGEPGVGKTRLLAEAERRLAGSLRILSLRAPEEEAGTPLAAFAGLLEDLCEIGPEVDLAERRGRVAAFLESRPGLTPGQRDILLRLFPGESEPGSAGDALPAIEALVGDLARTPLALLFEDRQWADEASLAALDRLAALAEDLPMLLVVSARPEARPPWPAATLCLLEPLSPAASAELVARLDRGWGMPLSVRENIADLSEGVPLFAEELARSWLDRLEENEVDLPRTLPEIITGRLDAMGKAKRTAQIGALVGRDLTPGLIARLEDRDPGAVEAELEALRAADVVRERRTPRGRFFRLKHALVEEGIYATLPPGERSVLHGRVARLLESEYPAEAKARPDWLARHLERSGDREGAARHLLQAARQSAHLGSHDQALTHLTHARRLLRQAPSSPERDALDRQLARFYTAQSLFPRGFGRAGDALAGQGLPPEEEAGFDDLLAGILPRLADRPWAEILKDGKRLLAVAEADDDAEEIRAARHLLGFFAYYAGDLPLAEAQFAEGLPEGIEHAPEWLVRLYNGPPKAVELAYRGLVDLRRGRSAEACQAEEAARNLARAYGSPNLTAYVLVLCAAIHRHAHDPGPTLELAREAVALSREEGLRAPRLAGMAYREWAKSALGIGGRLDRLQSVARAEGGNTGGFMLAALVAPAYGLQGHRERQIALARELFRCETGIRGPELYECDLYLGLGEALLETGETEEGEESLLLGIQAARIAGNRRQHLRGVIPLARYWLRKGWREEAKGILDGAVRDLPGEEDNPDLAEARSLQAECRRRVAWQP